MKSYTRLFEVALQAPVTGVIVVAYIAADTADQAADAAVLALNRANGAEQKLKRADLVGVKLLLDGAAVTIAPDCIRGKAQRPLLVMGDNGANAPCCPPPGEKRG